MATHYILLHQSAISSPNQHVFAVGHVFGSVKSPLSANQKAWLLRKHTPDKSNQYWVVWEIIMYGTMKSRVYIIVTQFKQWLILNLNSHAGKKTPMHSAGKVSVDRNQPRGSLSWMFAVYQDKQYVEGHPHGSRVGFTFVFEFSWTCCFLQPQVMAHCIPRGERPDGSFCVYNYKYNNNQFPFFIPFPSW